MNSQHRHKIGRLKNFFSLINATGTILLATACTQESTSKTYTGRFKVDAGTEYIALDTPSNIGGSCIGWNTVSIRKPGQNTDGLDNVICWKRDGDQIIITARDGNRQTSGPAAAWSD